MAALGDHPLRNVTEAAVAASEPLTRAAAAVMWRVPGLVEYKVGTTVQVGASRVAVRLNASGALVQLGDNTMLDDDGHVNACRLPPAA